MPVSRPWNIARIAWYYLAEMEPHPFELRLHFCIQGSEPDPYGVNKTNEGLDLVKGGWVYTASDDTVHSPALLKRLGEVIAEHPDAGAVVFSEQRPPIEGSRILRAAKENVYPGGICGSMIFYKREFLGDGRFDFKKHAQCCDGFLAQQTFEKDPSRWVFVDEVLLNFNALMI